MADIELVIKIPEGIYDYIHNEHIAMRVCDSHQVANAIANGTPLLKGHGDLIDVNRKITVPVYDEQYEEWGEKTLTVREALNRWSDEGVTIKDVVVLADNEQKTKINEDISKGFEEFTRMMFRQGQEESEVQDADSN